MLNESTAHRAQAARTFIVWYFEIFYCLCLAFSISISSSSYIWTTWMAWYGRECRSLNFTVRQLSTYTITYSAFQEFRVRLLCRATSDEHSTCIWCSCITIRRTAWPDDNSQQMKLISQPNIRDNISPKRTIPYFYLEILQFPCDISASIFSQTQK